MFNVFCATHFWVVWHFQTVGHVTSEADIENSSTNTLILYNIYYTTYQWTRLPSKGTTWFEDNLQMRIALMEILHETNQSLYVVVLTGDQMTTTKVNPLQLWEPLRELLFDMLQRTLKNI